MKYSKTMTYAAIALALVIGFCLGIIFRGTDIATASPIIPGTDHGHTAARAFVTFTQGGAEAVAIIVMTPSWGHDLTSFTWGPTQVWKDRLEVRSQ